MLAQMHFCLGLLAVTIHGAGTLPGNLGSYAHSRWGHILGRSFVFASLLAWLMMPSFTSFPAAPGLLSEHESTAGPGQWTLSAPCLECAMGGACGIALGPSWPV